MKKQKIEFNSKLDFSLLLLSIFATFFIGCASYGVAIKDNVGIQKVKSVVLIGGQAEFAHKQILKEQESGSILGNLATTLIGNLVSIEGSFNTYGESQKLLSQLGLFSVMDQSQFKEKITNLSVEVPKFLNADSLNIPKISAFAKALGVDGVLITFYQPYEQKLPGPSGGTQYISISISATETIPRFEGVLISAQDEKVVWRAKKSSTKTVFGTPKYRFETRLKGALESLFDTLKNETATQ